MLCINVKAQYEPKPKIPRVLILLDGSSSMSEEWKTGTSRFQEARKFIVTLVDSLTKANTQVEVALRLFGHQYPAQFNNCYDTKREIPFSRENISQIEARLFALNGRGVSPIAYSLSVAADEDFENESKYAYSIILVTDGGESCGGDICAVVNDLLRRKIFFRPYIVSLLDYAPLKDLYHCLGTLLTLTEEKDVPKVASKITEAHREGFDRAKTGKTIEVLPTVKKDTLRIPLTKVEAPKPIAPPVKKDSVAVVKPVAVVVAKPIEKPTVPTQAPKKIEAIPEPIRKKEKFNALKLNTKMKAYKTIIVDAPAPSLLKVSPFVWSKVNDQAPLPPERIKEKQFKSLAFAKKKLLNKSLKVFSMPGSLIVPPFAMSKFEPIVQTKADTIVIPITIPSKPDTTKLPPKPTVKVEKKPVPVVRPKTTPVVTHREVKIPIEEAKYQIEKLPAAETEVEVYFTDGNGKFYQTTPQILLSDPTTGKEVDRFYRTVGPNGKPDAAQVAAGTYHLSVVGSDRTFLKNIKLEEGMKNKIMITVGTGALQFVWKTGNKKEPVDKYFAQVKRNFVPQPMVTQRCDTILPYPPGNYHVEINTLPVMVRSLDLDFGSMKVIPIERPGTVQFTNTTALGKVKLYYPLGDRYVQFFQINVNGNPSVQIVELLPGPYEAHYSIANGLPEKVFKFYIKSEETNAVLLPL